MGRQNSRGSPAYGGYPRISRRSFLFRGSLFLSGMYLRRHLPGPSNVFSVWLILLQQSYITIRKLCKVPISAYAGTFAVYPIACINADFSFLSEFSHFVSPANAFSKATYLKVRFRFDKGGTGNLQDRTFRRFPVDRLSFSPLLAAIRTLDSWTSCDLDILTPIF